MSPASLSLLMIANLYRGSYFVSYPLPLSNSLESLFRFHQWEVSIGDLNERHWQNLSKAAVT